MDLSIRVNYGGTDSGYSWWIILKRVCTHLAALRYFFYYYDRDPKQQLFYILIEDELVSYSTVVLYIGIMEVRDFLP